jgi:hypothetical protein
MPPSHPLLRAAARVPLHSAFVSALGAHQERLGEGSEGPRPELARVLQCELDLVELALAAVVHDGPADVPVLRHWLGRAATTAQALSMRLDASVEVELTWPDGSSWRGVLDPATLDAPLPTSAWGQTWAAAWLAGDEALARALSDRALVDALRAAPTAAHVHGTSHRAPLRELLAAVTRDEAPSAAPVVLEAMDRDLEDVRLRDPHDEIVIHAPWLIAAVRPLVPVLTAIAARDRAAVSVALAHADAAYAAYAAEDAVDRPKGASLVLEGVRALARSRGLLEQEVPWRIEGPVKRGTVTVLARADAARDASHALTLAIQLAGYVRDAQYGVRWSDARVATLVHAGGAILDALDPIYDALVAELRAPVGPAAPLARGALAARALVAKAVARLDGPLDERVRRYTSVEPLVLDALPFHEREPARAADRDTWASIAARLAAAPPSPEPPSPAPPSPEPPASTATSASSKRRIVSRRGS